MPSDDELRTMAANPAHSNWLRHALTEALSRDPVDAANDAGLLALVLDKRSAEIIAASSAEAAIRKASHS